MRYEDLTADPNGVLEGICSFVGEAYDAAALLDEVDVERDAAGTLANRGRITENPVHWSDWLAEREARELEDALEPALGELGYRRYT